MRARARERERERKRERREKHGEREQANARERGREREGLSGHKGEGGSKAAKGARMPRRTEEEEVRRLEDSQSGKQSDEQPSGRPTAPEALRSTGASEIERDRTSLKGDRRRDEREKRPRLHGPHPRGEAVRGFEKG